MAWYSKALKVVRWVANIVVWLERILDKVEKDPPPKKEG